QADPVCRLRRECAGKHLGSRAGQVGFERRAVGNARVDQPPGFRPRNSWFHLFLSLWLWPAWYRSGSDFRERARELVDVLFRIKRSWADAHGSEIGRASCRERVWVWGAW